MRSHHIAGEANSVTAKWNGARWILSVEYKAEIPNLVHPNKTIVAGDFGLVHRVTFSDGVVVPAMEVCREE